MNRHLYHYHELDGAYSEVSRHSVKSRNSYGDNVDSLTDIYNIIDQRLNDYLTESHTTTSCGSLFQMGNTLFEKNDWW